MKHGRVLLLLGLLAMVVIFTLAARKLPNLLDSKLTGFETNTFTENILARAQAGEAHAQYSVGVQFAKGAFGREKNDTEARLWFEKAAQQGLVPAQLALARSHAWEFSIDRDEDAWFRAADWYRRAAQAGSAEAQCEFGKTLIKVEVSKVELDGTYDERAALGSQPGIQEALHWLRSAASQDLVDAQAELCSLLGPVYAITTYNGTRYTTFAFSGLGREGEFHYWLLKAATLGHVDSMYDLAEWNRYKRENYSEAAKWFEKAADKGSFRAMRQLGELYRYGMGVPKDAAQAAHWYAAAASAPIDDVWMPDYFGKVCFGLGLMAEEGVGLPRDLVEAYKWYNLAAGSENVSSGQFLRGSWTAYLLDRVSKQLSQEQIAEAQRRSTEFMRLKMSAPGDSTSSGRPRPITEPKAAGTGFFLSEDGWVGTCYHVIKDANKITVRLGGSEFPAKLVKWDAASDLALLKVEGKFSPLPIASKNAVSLGESVFTIGYPNIGIQGVQPKLTRGEISSVTGIQDDPRHYQISVPVQPGNSGGPLVDMEGNLVGIVGMRMDDIKALEATGTLPQNINYAIKADLLTSLVKSVPGLSAKVNKLSSAKKREFGAVVKQVQEATALVVVY